MYVSKKAREINGSVGARGEEAAQDVTIQCEFSTSKTSKLTSMWVYHCIESQKLNSNQTQTIKNKKCENLVITRKKGEKGQKRE